MTAVSAVIPVFNRAQVVGRAINSALAQNAGADSPLEIIVVDDGSSDDLDATLRIFGDRVSKIRHVRNLGAAAARNTGVAVATGDFVAFLDSDDEWLPGKLAKQIAAMHANQWAASCTAFHLIRPQMPDLVAPRIATGALGIADLAWGCFVSPGSTLVFERRVFAQIGPLDTELGRLEDWDWLLRYARRHALGFLAEPLARVNASSHGNVAIVLRAIATMRAKHRASFSRRDRRHFAAALDLERAAALYRAGDALSAMLALLKSWCRAPIRHAGLGAVWHNRSARVRSGFGTSRPS